MESIHENITKEKIVLVTGASGYLASHVVDQLLERGYRVRGTVRSLQNPAKVEPIYNINPAKRDKIELVEADLLNHECWERVVAGVDYVCHVASPFPSEIPANEADLITPAREGTIAVMKAAIRAKVRKIVITSSIAAVFTGRSEKNFFNESDWANYANSPPYERSKTAAEKAAWEIYEQHKDEIKMTIINPGFIQGPTFNSNQFTSSQVIERAMNGDMPAIPKVSMAIVDVRDVAAAHVSAIIREDETNGKRYLLTQGSYWLEDIVNILREEFNPQGWSLPSMTIGKCMFSIYACFDKQARLLLPFFGRMIMFDNTRSQEELGIRYRNEHKTLIEMAYDLIAKGIVRDRRRRGN